MEVVEVAMETTEVLIEMITIIAKVLVEGMEVLMFMVEEQRARWRRWGY